MWRKVFPVLLTLATLVFLQTTAARADPVLVPDIKNGIATLRIVNAINPRLPRMTDT